MARLTDLIRNPLAFLFTRAPTEELLAEYVVREHHRGRSVEEILDDPYVRNRATPEQIRHVFERPEVIHALGDDIVNAHLSKL